MTKAWSSMIFSLTVKGLAEYAFVIFSRMKKATAITISRDLTSSELHLHVIHIIMMVNLLLLSISDFSTKSIKKLYGKKRLTESEIDQLESCYEAAREVKKKTVCSNTYQFQWMWI